MKLLLFKGERSCKVCGEAAQHWAGEFYVATKDDRNPFRHRHIPVAIEEDRAIRLMLPYADIPTGMRTVPLSYRSRHGGLAGLRFVLRGRRRRGHRWRPFGLFLE